MKCLFLEIIFCFLLCYTTVIALKADSFRNVSERITMKGYPLEEHTVQTADGYFLSLLRIPYGRNNTMDEGDKKVVLLIHGEGSDARSWVLNLPNESLGFILPDEGCDVWLLNERGSDYSKNHVKFYTNQYNFWNFSLDEMAKYDVPATIDYILSVTEKQALYVIGHSRGNAVLFAMLSEFPEYNEKIKLLIALAPIAFVGHMKPIVPEIFAYKYPIASTMNLFSHGEFKPHGMLNKSPLELFCEFAAPELCKKVFFTLDNVDKAKLNELSTNLLSDDELPYNKLDESLLGLFCDFIDSKHCKTLEFASGAIDSAKLNETGIASNNALSSSSTSTKSLVHFAQLHDSKKFRKYDYGRLLNLEYYHQEEPPDYDIFRITTPVALISSLNDTIADPEDVDILRKQLKSLVFDYESPYPHKHFDFVAAKNAPEFIYEPVLQLLAQY